MSAKDGRDFRVAAVLAPIALSLEFFVGEEENYLSPISTIDQA